MKAKVVDVNHRRSPLIQGGIEIPIEVSVEMEWAIPFLKHTPPVEDT